MPERLPRLWRGSCPAKGGERGRAQMEKYLVYVLESLSDHGYYIGFTQDLTQRLAEHNAGKTRSLRARRPLKLIHVEEFSGESAAKKRERQIKSYKGGKAFRRLLRLVSVSREP